MTVVLIIRQGKITSYSRWSLHDIHALRQGCLLCSSGGKDNLDQYSLNKKPKNHPGCLLKRHTHSHPPTLPTPPKKTRPRILRLWVCIWNKQWSSSELVVLPFALHPWLYIRVTWEVHTLRLSRSHPGPMKSDSGSGAQAVECWESSLGTEELKNTALWNATKVLLSQHFTVGDYWGNNLDNFNLC